MSFWWSFMANIRFSFNKLPGLIRLAGLIRLVYTKMQCVQTATENIVRGAGGTGAAAPAALIMRGTREQPVALFLNNQVHCNE